MAEESGSGFLLIPGDKPLNQAEVGLLAFKELRASPQAFLDWLRHRQLTYLAPSLTITATGDGSQHMPYRFEANLDGINASIAALQEEDIVLQSQIDTLNTTVQNILDGDVSSTVLESTESVGVTGNGTIAEPYKMTVIPPTIVPFQPNFTLTNQISFRVRYTKDPNTNEVTLVIPNSASAPNFVTALSLGGNCPAAYFPSRHIHNLDAGGAILITCMIALEQDPGNIRFPALWLASFDEVNHTVGGSLRMVDGTLTFPSARYGVHSVVMKWFTDPPPEPILSSPNPDPVEVDFIAITS